MEGKKRKQKDEKPDGNLKKGIKIKEEKPDLQPAAVKQEKTDLKGVSLVEAAKKGSLLHPKESGASSHEPPRKLMSFKDQMSAPSSVVQRPGSSVLASLVSPKSAVSTGLFKLNKAAANKKVQLPKEKPKKEREQKSKDRGQHGKKFAKKFDKNDRYIQVQGVFSQGVADSELRKREKSQRASSSGGGGGGGGSRKATKRTAVVLGDNDGNESDVGMEDSEIPVIVGSLKRERKVALKSELASAILGSKREPKSENGVVEASASNSVEGDVEMSEVKREKLEDAKEESKAVPKSTGPILSLVEMPNRIPVELPSERGELKELGEIELIDGSLKMNIGGSVFDVTPGGAKKYPMDLAIISLRHQDERQGVLMNLGRITGHFILVPECLIPPSDPSDEPEPA